MKERPILFSAPMVRAILDGRKSQTRRVINPQPALLNAREDQWFHGRKWMPTTPSGKVGLVPVITMPYCVGDRLWVRETWQDVTPAFRDPGEEPFVIRYTADGEVRHNTGDVIPGPHPGIDHYPRRPSIYMPRWASRITLEVTDVRVQRLQNISEGDAIAEGREPCADGNPGNGGPFDWFKTLWDSINGKRPGCAWEANPWVWAVSFRPVVAR